MSRKFEFNVDNEIIKLLEQGEFEDEVYYLPKIELNRSTYEKVNEVLTSLGAKWNRKLKGFIYDYDIKDGLKKVIEQKKVTNWKKETNFFYTPKKVVETMISHVPLWYECNYKFLEPSCGQGHILDVIKEKFKNSEISCVEKNINHCKYLTDKGYSPICADFLDIKPEEKYDVILMNPPFLEEFKHIKHAYNFLKDDGYLVSVASGNVLEKNSKEAQEFKKWFRKKDGYCYKLPKNTFKECGTNINTVLLIFDKSNYLEDINYK